MTLSCRPVDTAVIYLSTSRLIQSGHSGHYRLKWQFYRREVQEKNFD